MVLQVGVTRHESENAWFLVTNKTTQVIGVTNDGVVISLYWGSRLTSTSDVHFPIALAPERSSQDPSITSAFEEYPVFGGLRFGPQVLKVEFSDGTRELDLSYSTSQHTKKSLSISFKDRVHDFFCVQLVYELDIENDMISRWPVLRNHSKHETVSVSKFQSGAWHIPFALDTQRTLVTLAGAWCQETQMQRHSVQAGTSHLLQSTRGIPSAQAYPYFAILDQSNEQSTNDVYFGTIEWSGNWSIEIQTNIQGNTTVIGGISDRDFGWTLGPLESTAQWRQPFTVGFTKEGMSDARTLMTRYVVTASSKAKQKLNPVLYNGWEVYGADVTMENQIKVAKHAAELGVELFVLDDGWFKGRSSDNAGLGDWYVDKTKFPNGLKPLSDKVHALGMKFGLWFEPEMVNPDSDLYRAHPDWIYYYPDYERYEERNQLVLNITKHEVQEYIVGRMIDIISGANVDYIKWDMNRPISEAGSKPTSNKDPKEVWVKHVLTVYSIIRRLKKEFPQLLIESCCSGGGRADVGILKEVDMCWPSDNTRPDARLLIQHGASCIIPPRFMSCWVTDSPNDDHTLSLIPISFRFHVSFMGTLGLGMNIEKHSREDLEQYRQWIDVYKKIRHIMQLGDVSWLIPPTNASTVSVTQTTVRDQTESVVLAFRQASPFWMALPAIKLHKLDKDAIYTICLWHTDPLKPAFTGELSGAYLLGKGIELPYLTSKAYSSVVVWLKKKKMN